MDLGCKTVSAVFSRYQDDSSDEASDRFGRLRSEVWIREELAEFSDFPGVQIWQVGVQGNGARLLGGCKIGPEAGLFALKHPQPLVHRGVVTAALDRVDDRGDSRPSAPSPAPR